MELTYDVLVHIFKYLSKFDRLSASETCRSWYEAANDHYFRKNKVVMFYDCILNDETLSPFKTFEDSTTPYYHYKFSDIDITEKFDNFWNIKGDTIRTLTLEYCFIRRREFIFMLQKCTKLESLNIVEGFLDFPDDQAFDEDILDNSLTELKSLSFFGPIRLTDTLLARLMSAAPALEEFRLSVSSLQFDTKLLRTYYPPESPHAPSRKILRFSFILQLIKFNAKNIKCLKFTKYGDFNSATIQSLLETDNLKLLTLKLHRLSEAVDLKPLTTHQVSLKELSVGFCSNITDQSLIDICNNLVNLENLDIPQCYKLTDLGVSKLTNLKKLKSLNISYCKKITQDALIGGICAEVNVILEVLQVASLDLDQNTVIRLSENLPNLRSLNLRRCHKGVTDMTLQFIFKNQQLLQTLDIRDCHELSDAGFTGMKILEPDEDNEGGSLLSNLHQLPPVKSAKVDKEIVYVCEQEFGIIFCAKRILDSGFSLSHLKRLKELNISGCYNISDVSLAHAFNFEELTILNLNCCGKITHKGLKCLVKNCPTIEHLSAVECNIIEHKSMQEILKTLRWLKRLETSKSSIYGYIRARRVDNVITFIDPERLYRIT